MCNPLIRDLYGSRLLSGGLFLVVSYLAVATLARNLCWTGQQGVWQVRPNVCDLHAV